MSLSVGERIENREAGTCSGCHKARDVGSGTPSLPAPCTHVEGWKGAGFQGKQSAHAPPSPARGQSSFAEVFSAGGSQEALETTAYQNIVMVLVSGTISFAGSANPTKLVYRAFNKDVSSSLKQNTHTHTADSTKPQLYSSIAPFHSSPLTCESAKDTSPGHSES